MGRLHKPAVLSNRQQKTRLALMHAFYQLVIDRGFSHITVTDIAQEANYGRWTFYQYFADKEDVALQTFLYWMAELDTHLIAAVQHLSTPYREYESWRMIFQAFDAQRPFFASIAPVIAPVWRNQAKEFLIQQFLGHLQAGHFQLMSGIRPEIAARLYVAVVLELLEAWGNNPELGHLELLVDELFIFMFNQPPPGSK